jgi:APA family basic amino acid/polyamine antiporter
MGSLKRSEGLSEIGAISFAVGSMIGAGVFVLSGLVIAEAGGGAILSYVLAGVLITFTGISYAILASIYPEDGGGFLYTEKMLGPFPGFLAGWGMYTFQIIAQAFVLISFGIYLELLLGLSFDPRPLALAAVIGLTLLNMRGLNEAGKAELALVGAKIIVLIIFILVGLASVTPGDIGTLTSSGSGSILAGTAMVMFAYTGFQVVSMMAGEVKESSKKVPWAIMVSIFIVMAIYVLVIVALLAANLDTYGNDSVFRAAKALIGPIGATMISAAAVVSTLSAANSGMVGSSRIVMEMASERQLPGRFAKLKGGQPHNAILLASGLTSIFIIYGDLTFIIDVTNFLVLVTNVLVNLSALMLVLRKYPVEPYRKLFHSPFRGIIPALGAVTSVGIMFALPVINLLPAMAILALGAVFYLIEDTPSGKKAILEIRQMLGREMR